MIKHKLRTYLILFSFLGLVIGCLPSSYTETNVSGAHSPPPFITPVPTVVVLGAAGEYQVIVDVANLRRLPDLGSETAVVLHKNDIIPVDGRTDDSRWFHTPINGGAWISAEFIAEYNPNVEIIEAPAGEIAATPVPEQGLATNAPVAAGSTPLPNNPAGETHVVETAGESQMAEPITEPGLTLTASYYIYHPRTLEPIVTPGPTITTVPIIPRITIRGFAMPTSMAPLPGRLVTRPAVRLTVPIAPGQIGTSATAAPVQMVPLVPIMPIPVATLALVELPTAAP